MTLPRLLRGRSDRPLAALAALAALGVACAAEVPESPTWVEVAPILRASCVRCHSAPPRGGAPRGFRLDVWETTLDDDGALTLGAGALASYSAARVAEETMPPRFALAERHADILEAWAASAGEGMPAPLGPPAPGNRPPTIRLEGDLDRGQVEGRLVLRYDSGDPDGDLIYGALYAVRSDRRIRITRELRTGRGVAIWDAAAAGPGVYELYAEISDGSADVEVTLGRFEVRPGSAAPSIEFRTSLRDALIRPAEGPLALELLVADTDSPALRISVEAVSGDLVVPVADLEAAPGELALEWNPEPLAAGDLWRLRARVSDGEYERVALSSPFIVARADTALRYADVEEIFASSCAPCHPGQAPGGRPVPELGFDLSRYGREGGAGVYELRGAIYRRAVHEETMPPPSARALFDPPVGLSDADRERLREWLLGGAPR